MNYIEFLHNRDKYLGENHDDFLMHYGVLGQKWGQRHWQNPDGTYTTEGKIRYFGSKKAQAEINADETKIGSKTSDAKDYLKFRNKMLKERTRPDLNEWYRDKNKYLDKQLVRDAKRVDKQQQKMYKNQLKEWYDNPEDLVADLNAMYKIGGQPGKNNTSIPKKIYEANKNDPQALKILEDYYKNHRDEENKDPETETEAMDKFYNEKEEQKLGGFPWNIERAEQQLDKKEFKEAKRLAQKLNFDNGTKVIKELKNTEYGKKHIKPLYDEFEENMNKISDKANKIIKDNPVDEIEAGIANAIDTSGGNANIGYIINCIRKQHYANSADSFINVDSLPLLKSEEDLWTEALKYKKDFGDKIEKEFKNLYPKAKTNLSYFIALTDYENDKLDKIYDMNDEDYRRYQLYHQINYGLVPEVNKKSIRKDIIEPAEKLYPKVEKIINNTKVGDPTYDWSDIGKALVELGLDKKNADELTNADWKKVYEICSQ